jgi:DNA-binding LacI/PurR family transcriptional regulator
VASFTQTQEDEMARSRVTQPTIHDVARLAGVSGQTVSRVLNDHPSVRPETRLRITDAIDQLGYRRNRAARALVSQHSSIIGAVVVTPDQFGPSSTLIGIERAASQNGYWVSVVSLPSGNGDDMTTALKHLDEGGVDGIVVITPNQAALQAAAHGVTHVPKVAVSSGPVGEYGMVAVDMDNELGTRLAMDHLLGLGHTEIAQISGPANDFHARARVDGWRAALRKAKVPTGYLLEGDWRALSGYECARELLRVKNLPTAVFAGNDHMALGALRAFHEAGLRVPEDISVVGFDDVSGSSCFIPPLTTVRPDHAELGRAALETLQQLINGEQPEDHRVTPAFIERESTAPPRG